MARLTIEQVKGPNMSAAGQMLANAGTSLDRGLSAASDILGSYQEGQQAVGDQQVVADMANINSEEELAAYLQSGALDGLNLSAAMRQNVLGLRSGIIDNQQGRANISLTNANTGLVGANTNRVNGAEGRDASAFAYGQETTRQTNAAGALALAAGQDARQFGQTGNRPEVYRNGIAAIESDGTGGYDAIGPTDDTLGRALGRYQIMEANIPEWSRAALGREVTVEEFMASSDIQDAIFDHRFGGYVAQYGEEGAAQAWFGGVGGVGQTDRTDSLGRLTIGDYGSDFLSNIQGSDGGNGAASASMAELQTFLQNSPNITPEVGQSMIDRVLSGGQIGQTQLDAAEAERVANSGAQATIDALQNPDILSLGGVASANLNNPNISPSERIAAANAGRNQGTINADILAPATTLDPLVAATERVAAEDRASGIAAMPQTILLETAKRYSGDPVGGLIADLGIGPDGETRSDYNNDELRSHMQEIVTAAKNAGIDNVTMEMVAAGMGQVFKRDPWGRNTADNRFDTDEVVRYLSDTIGQSGMNAYNEARISSETADGRAQAAQLEMTTLQSRLAKTTDPDTRRQLQQQISDSRARNLTGQSRQQGVQALEEYVRNSGGMAARLRDARADLEADPESTGAFRAMMDLEEQIRRDPDIGESEKRLLISALRG